jgi:hypothetical protein
MPPTDSTQASPPLQRPALDWVLTNYDAATSDPPQVETELRRLQCLKTYHMLDQDPQPCLDRLARMAATICHTPMAMITLVDLGRDWHLASYGVPEGWPREVPRLQSLGAHAIISKLDIMMVPDALHDTRFVQNPFVTAGLRFYAAAPLCSPEGSKLGTMCVLDTQPHPLGLTQDQAQLLQDCAATAMELLERQRLLLQMGTPLENIEVQRSIKFLQQHLQALHHDFHLNAMLNDTHKHMLRSACDSASYLHSTLVPAIHQRGKHLGTMTTTSTATIVSSSSKGNSPIHPGITLRNNGASRSDPAVGQVTTIDLALFIKNLEFAMESFPKHVPLVMTLDPELPDRLVWNDLQVFRSTLALLTSACERTLRGFVRLRLFARQRTVLDREVVFECEDTGPDVRLDQYPQLFEAPPPKSQGEHAAASSVSSDGEDDSSPGDDDCIAYDHATGQMVLQQCRKPGLSEGLAVYAVAKYIGGLGGDYGFRPRESEDDEDDHEEDDDETDRPADDDGTGSIFWFSLPLRLPSSTATLSEAKEPTRPLDAVAPFHQKTEMTARSSQFEASCL